MGLKCLINGHNYKTIEKYCRPYNFEGWSKVSSGSELVIVKECTVCGRVRSWKIR